MSHTVPATPDPLIAKPSAESLKPCYIPILIGGVYTTGIFWIEDGMWGQFLGRRDEGVQKR